MCALTVLYIGRDCLICAKFGVHFGAAGALEGGVLGGGCCEVLHHQFRHLFRKVDVRLPGKGNSNSHGARPVHLTITMIKWIRTSRLSVRPSLEVVAARYCTTSFATCESGPLRAVHLSRHKWPGGLVNER